MSLPIGRTRRARGFTLIEIMISVTLLGIVGAILSTVLVRQQRFHRAVTQVTDARARMRDIATILPTDLRSISSAGHDILAISDTSIQFRAFVGAGIVCNYATADDNVTPAIIELPPQELASGNVLTSWINPPAPNDVAYLYDNGGSTGNADDSWAAYKISDTSSAADATWCPPASTFTTADDATARRYRITLTTPVTQTRILRGAPIRFAREVRYSIYLASDNQWYVGFQPCTPHLTYGTPGTCGTREVLAGPVKPGTADTLTSGLFFVFRKRDGTRVTTVSSADTIASVNVGIRTMSGSLLGATSSKAASEQGGDSLRFTVGLRNRI
jgi:prepilin-type N-terminal cleavage/methylation domain-containing protein